MLQPGDFAPDFVLPSAQGVLTRFYGKAGGAPALILFLGSGEAVEAWAERARASFGASLDVFFVLAAAAGEAGTREIAFVDLEGRVRAAYGLGDRRAEVHQVSEVEPALEPAVAEALFLLDPNLRILSAERLTDPGEAFLPAHRALEALHREAPRTVSAQAPVLLVPKVLDPPLCARLIDLWHAEGHAATGVERTSGRRRRVEMLPESKRREDHTVSDPELVKLLTQRIGRRLMREVEKVFSFKATRFEGFKIVCYDAASGGWFRRHRDNLSPATRHRRFALTVNLNEDYEGGQLRFPEYSDDLYCPNSGGAIVFSGALVHEVRDVTKGRRFALLSFLFGDEDLRSST